MHLPVLAAQLLLRRQIFSISGLCHSFSSNCVSLSFSQQVFAVMLTTSIQTAGNHANLILTKAIIRMLLVEDPLCDQFHLVITSSLKDTFANQLRNTSKYHVQYGKQLVCMMSCEKSLIFLT